MSSQNPYQPSELPAETLGDPERLPASSYVSAGCSAMFVFVGGALVVIFLLGFFVLPLWMIFAISLCVALLLGGISAWETLRLERRKRRERRRAEEGEAMPP